MIERERGAERRDDDEFRLGFSTLDDTAAAGRRVADRKVDPEPVAPSTEGAEFARQMDVARRSMRKHRNVLAALAK